MPPEAVHLKARLAPVLVWLQPTTTPASLTPKARLSRPPRVPRSRLATRKVAAGLARVPFGLVLLALGRSLGRTGSLHAASVAPIKTPAATIAVGCITHL